MRFSEAFGLVQSWQNRADILKREISLVLEKTKKWIMANKLYNFAMSIVYKSIKKE